MAIETWAARIVANGVDAADFTRITSAITGWDQWCRAWCAAAAVHEDLGRAALADGRRLSGGGHLAQAAVYYHFAKFLFVQDLTQMRAAHGDAVRCLDDALPHLSPPGERAEIPFDGAVLAGVLRRPAGPGPHPAVVLIPGLDSAKEEFRAVEQPFLDRGLATFAVDGPGQGEAEYALAIRPDWEVPGEAILDAVSAMPGVDGRRIGLWGVSLGGYYAPRLASGDRRVRACVALSGPLRLRAGLGSASRADPGGVPGALEVAECGRGLAPRHGAQPGRPGRAHHRAAADRGGRAGQPHAVAAVTPAGG